MVGGVRCEGAKQSGAGQRKPKVRSEGGNGPPFLDEAEAFCLQVWGPKTLPESFREPRSIWLTFPTLSTIGGLPGGCEWRCSWTLFEGFKEVCVTLIEGARDERTDAWKPKTGF